MTVIAWDGKTLAADKRMTSYDCPTTVTKIARAVTGELLAVSGSAAVGLALINWYEQGRIRESYPSNSDGSGDSFANMLVIYPGGTVMRYESTAFPIQITEPFCAMGSGRDYALAAMHLGHDSRKAVEVACVFDVGCGNGVDVLTLEEPNGNA